MALDTIRTFAYWLMILVYFLATGNAQLISHSMLHYITRADLAHYNLTHPDDAH